MTYELSYAGIPLCVPTPRVLAWVRRVVPRQALNFPGPLGWPASSLAGAAAPTTPQRRRGRVGSLYWPSGASRCAVGHFVASRTQLDQIQLAVPDGEAATLVLDTGHADGRVSTPMLLLPPRPLSGGVASADNDPSFLCTFVDDRYQWWSAVADDTLTVGGDTTPWNDLISALAASLGITVTTSSVPTGTFGYAPDGMDLAGVPAAMALDAVCYACGLRVSRRLDGTVHAKNFSSDYDTLGENLDHDWSAASGGEFRLDPDGLPPDATAPSDQSLLLPETARLIVQDDDGPNTIDVAVPSTSTLLTTDRTGGRRAWLTRRSAYNSGRDGDYADAFVRDYATRLISAVSRQYAGIVPWTPEGTSEAIEWVYLEWRAETVIHPPPWSDGVTEIVGKAALSGTKGARVRPTGRPYVQGGKRYYPGYRDLDDATGPGYHDGPVPIWVVQRDEELLDTRGLRHYAASRKLSKFTVTTCDDEEEERELWVTTEFIVMIDFDKDTCQVVRTGVYEGEAICDTLTHGGEAILHGGELIGVG